VSTSEINEERDCVIPTSTAEYKAPDFTVSTNSQSVKKGGRPSFVKLEAKDEFSKMKNVTTEDTTELNEYHS
jgi:hypothetical protein